MTVAATALGMITPVGWDAPTACASIRAGLVRAQPVDGFEVLDPEQQESVAVIGHPVAGYTDGFGMTARWNRLFDGAIDSLWATESVPPVSDVGFWRDTGLMVVTPCLRDRRFGTVDRTAEYQPMPDFVSDLAERKLGGTLAPENTLHLDMGRVGVAAAINQVERWLQAGKVQRVVVSAVDSYLDPMTLEWLSEHNRLKTPDMPVGLAPGEAGVALLLEAEPAAAQRDAKVIMEIAGVGRGMDHDIYGDDVNVGRGLARATRECLEAAGFSTPFRGDIIWDHNGENWRAHEYGSARVLLSSELQPGRSELVPAVSLGDTGAASAAVGLCVAGRSFVGKYSSTNECLVLCSTERGESAALLAIAGSGAGQ